MKQLRKNEVKKLFKEFKRDKEVAVILENVEYARNVAGAFRTVDAAGIETLYLTGISIKPPFGKDLKKASRNKEDSVKWRYSEETAPVIADLKKKGFKVFAVELTDNAVSLADLAKEIAQDEKVCFVFGSEVFGLKKATLARCDKAIVIPMYGKGASLNVGTSVGIVLYSF